MKCLFNRKVKPGSFYQTVITLYILISPVCFSFNIDENKSEIKTVLILGNSIVLHSPRAEIGWYGDWGMAASVRDSDFVHLLIRDIHKKDSTVMVKFMNIADFERNLPGSSCCHL